MQPASPCVNKCSNLSLGFRAGAVSSPTPGTISKRGEFVAPFMLCQELRKRKTAAANALKDLQLIFTRLNREADIATTCPARLKCLKEKAGTARKTIGLLQQEASSVKDIQRSLHWRLCALLYVPWLQVAQQTSQLRAKFRAKSIAVQVEQHHVFKCQHFPSWIQISGQAKRQDALMSLEAKLEKATRQETATLEVTLQDMCWHVTSPCLGWQEKNRSITQELLLLQQKDEAQANLKSFKFSGSKFRNFWLIAERWKFKGKRWKLGSSKSSSMQWRQRKPSCWTKRPKRTWRLRRLGWRDGGGLEGFGFFVD